MDGALSLTLGLRAGRTCIVEQEHRAPLKVQVPIYSDPAMPGMATVYILSSSGGVLQGDRFTIGVRADERTQVRMTTPAATKIYRSTGQTATQHVHLRTAAESYLEYVPGPVIPFRDARFVESVTLEADPSSTLIFAETICSGRIARDERHAYALYSSRVEAHNPEGSLLFVDHNYISPNDTTPVTPGLMISYDVLGIMHILTPYGCAPDLAVTLQNLVSDVTVVLGGASQMPAGCGVTMRLLGRRMEEVTAVVQQVCETVRAVIFDRTESSGKERDH